MTPLRFSGGPDDERFFEVDDDFRRVLVDLAPLVAAAGASRARVFHRAATTARGSLRLDDRLQLPEHSFFRASRRFNVLARYSNSMESDDIAPAIRGVAVRLLEPARDDHAGVLDLSLNTGD